MNNIIIVLSPIEPFNVRVTYNIYVLVLHTWNAVIKKITPPNIILY